MTLSPVSAPPFPWGDRRRFFSYAAYFRRQFGGRVQKLSVDAGFTCPNRDGTLGTTGCTFCNSEAFSPSYCREVGSITRQIDEGIAFHRHRYRKSVRYVVYFQAYSNTYAPLADLRRRYEEALAHPSVSGLVVGTRPDCVDEAKLDYLASLRRRGYVGVEYGIESCFDRTLATVGRGHDFACTCRAVRQTAQRGLPVGGHLILGLPGESREQMLAQADLLNALPLTSVKLHQLQILRGSSLERQLGTGSLPAPFALDDYVALVCDLLERLRPDMVVERFAGEVPPRFQACPERAWRHADGRWVRNEEVVALVEQELARRDTWQGIRCGADGCDPSAAPLHNEESTTITIAK
ncbi:MAG: TIGR01212 family radical SAM protein [Bacteroidales bacterium]|nr:TIGR01212 family radical SAM protein [Bacteroidales bacterium]